MVDWRLVVCEFGLKRVLVWLESGWLFCIWRWVVVNVWCLGSFFDVIVVCVIYDGKGDFFIYVIVVVVYEVFVMCSCSIIRLNLCGMY